MVLSRQQFSSYCMSRAFALLLLYSLDSRIDQRMKRSFAGFLLNGAITISILLRTFEKGSLTFKALTDIGPCQKMAHQKHTPKDGTPVSRLESRSVCQSLVFLSLLLF